MSNDEDEKLSETAERVMGKTRRPHKFCSFCGQRNDARAEVCESCGKDISWMRIPESVPYPEAPPEKPRKLPEQRRSMSRRGLVIALLIIALIIVAVVILISVFNGSDKSGGAVLPSIGIAVCTAGLLSPAGYSRRRGEPSPCDRERSGSTGH